MRAVVEDFSPYYIGKCCSRSCYYISKLHRMEFCPYCSGELKIVYDYFALFGLEEERVNGWRGTVSDKKLRQQYKELSQVFHPDKHPEGDEAFLLLGAARAALATGARRSSYENLLQRALYSIRMQEEEIGNFSEGADYQKYSPHDVDGIENTRKGNNGFQPLYQGKLHAVLLLFSLLVAIWGALNFLLTQNYVMALIFAVVVFGVLVGYRHLQRMYAVLTASLLFTLFIYWLLNAARMKALTAFLFFAAFLFLCEKYTQKKKKLTFEPDGDTNGKNEGFSAGSSGESSYENNYGEGGAEAPTTK